MKSIRSPRGSYLLRAARILDVEAGVLRQNAAIRIEGDEITAVGELSLSSGVTVLDLGDVTLLPGLHDNHCHLMFRSSTFEQDIYKRSSAKKTLDALVNAQKTLWAGFTTVRDPGDCDWQYGLIDLRNFINQGLAAGPRILVAPHYLSITGGHGDANDYACDLCMRGVGKIVDGVEEMRKAVREEIKFGADWIKLFASGGVLSVGDDPSHTHYSREELAIAAEEAHRHGKKITAHAHGAEAVRFCAELGFDSIEHCSMIDDAGIEAMKKNGVYCVPTLYVIDFLLSDPQTPAPIAQKAEWMRRYQRQRFSALVARGVKVAYGTDIGVFPHGENWRDFPCMVECGMSPLEAIRAATLQSAKMNGIFDEVGALTPGRKADIIAVPGNPLIEIERLQEVCFVMKGGAVFRSDS